MTTLIVGIAIWALIGAYTCYIGLKIYRANRKIVERNMQLSQSAEQIEATQASTDRLLAQMEQTVDAIQVTYKDALSLLAVIAQGPTLPSRTYQRLAQQFFEEHEVKAQVTVVEHEQSKAVH